MAGGVTWCCARAWFGAWIGSWPACRAPGNRVEWRHGRVGAVRLPIDSQFAEIHAASAVADRSATARHLRPAIQNQWRKESNKASPPRWHRRRGGARVPAWRPRRAAFITGGGNAPSSRTSARRSRAKARSPASAARRLRSRSRPPASLRQCTNPGGNVPGSGHGRDHRPNHSRRCRRRGTASSSSARHRRPEPPPPTPTCPNEHRTPNIVDVRFTTATLTLLEDGVRSDEIWSPSPERTTTAGPRESPAAPAGLAMSAS